MPQPVQLNIEQLDDPLIGDGTSSFMGGMSSNDQANLIGENESSLLLNCDRERTGRITTRKGSILLGGGPVPSGGSIIQGIAYYWTPANKYLVVGSGGKLWRLQEPSTWVQIATGGVPLGAEVDIYKLASVNATLAVGATTIPVSGLTGIVVSGDLFILQNDPGQFKYTVTGHTET